MLLRAARSNVFSLFPQARKISRRLTCPLGGGQPLGRARAQPRTPAEGRARGGCQSTYQCGDITGRKHSGAPYERTSGEFLGRRASAASLILEEWEENGRIFVRRALGRLGPAHAPPGPAGDALVQAVV